MTTTWILRFALWLLIMAAILVLTVIADKIISHLHQRWLGGELDGFIESVVFFVIMNNRIWDWLKRRVWIGSKSSRP